MIICTLTSSGPEHPRPELANGLNVIPLNEGRRDRIIKLNQDMGDDIKRASVGLL